MSTVPRVTMEELLGQADFIRTLAGKLLVDANRADDVVQETWLAALRRGPAGIRSPRSWLAGVVRHVALKSRREEGRRARREALRLAPPGTPSPEEVLEREAERRRVVRAVLALDEPYRSTVLLRYFEGLPVKEVARRSGVPVETVRTRLKRARERLRDRLVEEHSGDRRSFCLALVALSGLRRAPALLPAAKAALVAAVAAAVLVSAGTVVFSPPELPSPPVPSDPVLAAAAEPEVKEVLPLATASAAPGARRDGRTAARAKKPAAAVPAGVVAGRVALAEGVLPVGTRVEVRRPPWAVDHAGPFTATTDADGAFRLSGVPPGEWVLSAIHPNFATHRLRFDLAEDAGGGPFELFLTHGGSLLVTVTGDDGGPLADEEVTVEGPGDLQIVTARGKTDADGRLLLPRLDPGTYSVGRGGKSATRSVSVVLDETKRVFLCEECVVKGVVRGPDGEPLHPAIVRLTVAFGEKDGYRSFAGRTDERGRFEIAGVAPGRHRVTVQNLAPPGGWVAPLGELNLYGGRTVERDLEVADTTLSGRILDASTGKPFTSGQVSVSASRVDRPGSERLLTFSYLAFPDEAGRYSFRGLPAGCWRLSARRFSDEGRTRSETRFHELPETGVLEDVDFALHPLDTGRIRVKVFEPDGSPAAGVTFSEKVGLTMWRTLLADETSTGVYELELETGTRVVSAGRPGRWARDLTVAVLKDAVLERTIRLRPSDR